MRGITLLLFCYGCFDIFPGLIAVQFHSLTTMPKNGSCKFINKSLEKVKEPNCYFPKLKGKKEEGNVGK